MTSLDQRAREGLSVKEILSLRPERGWAGPGEEPSERTAQQLCTPCWEKNREGAGAGRLQPSD